MVGVGPPRAAGAPVNLAFFSGHGPLCRWLCDGCGFHNELNGSHVCQLCGAPEAPNAVIACACERGQGAASPYGRPPHHRTPSPMVAPVPLAADPAERYYAPSPGPPGAVAYAPLPVSGLRASASHLRGLAPPAQRHGGFEEAPASPPMPPVTVEHGAAAWRAERIRETLSGLNDMTYIGVSGGQAVREQMRKLLDTVLFVLGRMSAQDGCVVLSALQAATRRALSAPLQGCELMQEEVSAVLATTGGEVLLEDCGFEKFDPPPPAEEEVEEVVYEMPYAEEGEPEAVASAQPAPARRAFAFPPMRTAAPVPAAKAPTVKKTATKTVTKPKAAGPAARYLMPKGAKPKDDALGKQVMPTGLTKFESSLWAAFELADKDGNGTLSRAEFCAALKATGLVDTDAEARREWTATDSDKSGTVDWKEFKRLGKRRKVLATLPKVLQAKPEKVEAAANVIQARLRKRAGTPAPAPPPREPSPARPPAPSLSRASSAATFAPVASAESDAPPPSTPPAGAPSFSRVRRPQPPGLTPFEAKLWRTFDALLPEGDTSRALSRRELDGALWAARFQMGTLKTKQLASLFAQADANADGRIDWEEFKAFGHLMPQLAELDPGEEAEPQAVSELFRGPMWVILPVSGAEGLALLRGVAELLERCLEAWVHWSTEEGTDGDGGDANPLASAAAAQAAALHGASARLPGAPASSGYGPPSGGGALPQAAASPARRFAAATHQFRYQDAMAPDTPLAYAAHPAHPAALAAHLAAPGRLHQHVAAAAGGSVPPGVLHAVPALAALPAVRHRLEYVYESGYGRGRQDGVADGFGEGAAQGYGEGHWHGQTEGFSSGVSQGKVAGTHEGFGMGHYQGHRDGYEQGLTYGHRQGFERGKEDGRREGRAEGFEIGKNEGKAQGRAEGKNEGQVEGRFEGEQRGFESGLQEGMVAGRQEGYTHGHADGYDERAHFESEARRLQALPRFVRPQMRALPSTQTPWRPPGSGSSTSPLSARSQRRVGASAALLGREGPKTAAYDILRRTADELQHLKM